MSASGAALEVAPSVGGGQQLRAMAAVAGTLLFFTNLDIYAHEVWSAPSSTFWVLCFVAIAAAAVAATPQRLAVLAQTPFAWWLFGYFCMTTAWAIFMTDVPVVSQTLVDRYRSIALLLALAILFAEPPVRRAGLLAVAAGVVLGSLLNLAESVGLRFAENEARVPGRSAGFYVNANASGLAIALGVAAALPTLPSRWRTPLLLVGAAGVAITFSRSAVLVLAVVTVALAWTGAVKLGRTVALTLLAIGSLAWFSGQVTGYLESAGVLNENTWSRLRLANDDSGRIELARRSWELFLEAPLAGNGIGATSDWDVGMQTHNQYLSLAADHGILGLLMLPLLAVALVWRSGGALAFPMGLLAAGLFSHGLLYERCILLLLGLVGAGGTRRAGSAS